MCNYRASHDRIGGCDCGWGHGDAGRAGGRAGRSPGFLKSRVRMGGKATGVTKRGSGGYGSGCAKVEKREGSEGWRVREEKATGGSTQETEVGRTYVWHRRVCGQQEAVPILLDGLSRLEYRGYDSPGLRFSREKRSKFGAVSANWSISKNHSRKKTSAEPVESAIRDGRRMANHPSRMPIRTGPTGVSSSITGSSKTMYRSSSNWQRRVQVRSETDTEVVAHLIDKHIKTNGMRLADAVRAAAKDIRGSYAITVISEREPGPLVAARSGCPLVIGRTEESSFVGSDVMAMLAHTRDVTFLDEGDVVEVTAKQITITDLEGRPVTRKKTTVTWDASAAEKSGYPHYMLKEIHEQPQTILDTMRGRYSYDSGEADLPDIGLTPKQFAQVGRIWIVACGTSWHAGLVGKYLFEEMVRTPVQVDIGVRVSVSRSAHREGRSFYYHLSVRRDGRYVGSGAGSARKGRSCRLDRQRRGQHTGS